MKIKDMKQAVKLLENEWDLGEKESRSIKTFVCVDIFD